MTEPFTLDVRDLLRSRGEPLSQILQAVERLAAGQPLRLLATFEPLPLYAVLGREGFDHSAVRYGEGNWEVIFSPHAADGGPGAGASCRRLAPMRGPCRAPSSTTADSRRRSR